MPPRASRNPPVATTSGPTSPTPTPPSAGADSIRSGDTSIRVPNSPVQVHSDRAQADHEPSRIPEPRLASAAELKRLNDIISDLQRQVQSLMPTQSPKVDRHSTIDRGNPYREASYASTTYTSVPHQPKIKASDLPRFSGGTSWRGKFFPTCTIHPMA
jgi:hypothetical protein